MPMNYAVLARAWSNAYTGVPSHPVVSHQKMLENGCSGDLLRPCLHIEIDSNKSGMSMVLLESCPWAVIICPKMRRGKAAQHSKGREQGPLHQARQRTMKYLFTGLCS